MEILRKILREQLSQVLSSLREDNTRMDLDTNLTNHGFKGAVSNDPDADKIIYDYNKAAQFASNNLQNDIVNLDMYSLADYLPESEVSEKWSFQAEGNYGVMLMVDIYKKIENNGTFWSLVAGILYKDSSQPVITDKLYNVQGYRKFIDNVNRSISFKIDPSRME